MSVVALACLASVGRSLRAIRPLRPCRRLCTYSGVSLPRFSRIVALVKQCFALAARHRGAITGSDTFHFGPVCSFLVARITHNHAVIIEGVQVTLLSFVPGALAASRQSSQKRVPHRRFASTLVCPTHRTRPCPPSPRACPPPRLMIEAPRVSTGYHHSRELILGAKFISFTTSHIRESSLCKWAALPWRAVLFKFTAFCAIQRPILWVEGRIRFTIWPIRFQRRCSADTFS
jgi:hypothetical protein